MEKFMTYFLKQPVIWILLIVCILLDAFYKKFRGYMGEFWVKNELNKLPSKKYKVLNDIMISIDGETHQIDHIVVSIYGLFVIEMKNYYGKIYGKEYYEQWTQYLGKNKYNFYNPIRQNYGHIQALMKLLNCSESMFVPIVVFSNNAKLKVESKKPVVNLDFLVNTIKKSNTQIIELTMVDEIYKKIENSNIVDRKLRKEHVKRIKEKIRK